jgi:hypothetical protein
MPTKGRRFNGDAFQHLSGGVADLDVSVTAELVQFGDAVGIRKESQHASGGAADRGIAMLLAGCQQRLKKFRLAAEHLLPGG